MYKQFVSKSCCTMHDNYGLLSLQYIRPDITGLTGPGRSQSNTVNSAYSQTEGFLFVHYI